MPDYTLSKPADDRELARFLDICALALHFPRELADRFAKISGRDAFRVVRSTAPGNAIAGGLVIHDMGQFFGGESVPMGGIGAVGVAPEFRAAGAATSMMTLALRDMRDHGYAISSLYPATVPLYRRAGYELAGSRYEISIPIRQMRAGKADASIRTERIEDADRPRIEAFYTQHARHTPGLLDRRSFSWKRVYEPRGEKAQGYKAVNAAGEIEGFVFILQKDAPPVAHAHAPLFYLLVNDVLFSSPAAGARILEFLRQHQSVCETATLYGSPDHPLLALIPERIFTARHQFHWMLRMLDVEKALTMRGWNPSVRGEVAIDVRDDALPENNAKFTLSVSDGSAAVKRGGNAGAGGGVSGGAGDVIIDIRGLAALYTGHLSPHDLVAWGRLQVADHARDPQRVLDTLGGLFAGPRPWLGDMF